VKALKDLIARAGLASQVLIGLNGSNAAIMFGSAGDALIERTASDVLALGSGDKLQQALRAVAPTDLTNLMVMQQADWFYGA